VTAKPVASVNPPKPEEKTDTQVTVKTGDTAGRIASNAKPSNVSLDQMLVALLRANPEAFVGGNINRIRAGSVLELPTAEKAQATPATEATQIIVAQSKDFNDFRRKLAGSAPSTQVAEADKKASGSVQTKVEEKKPAAATPDKLTLSKGNVQGKPAADKLAKEGNAKEAAGRTAEIAKNISDLNKLSAASSTVTAGAVPAPKTASAPVATIAVPVVAPVIPVPVASAPVAPVSAPAPVASKPAEAAVIASAPKPTVTASAKKPAVTPETQPEPGLLDGLLNDPLVPMGAGGLLALLAGWGLYRFKQKRDADKAEKDAMDSRLQPESFFGTSGGQSVDTNDRGGGSSSMAYSPSQLDAVDDVDPVAEADVYLAYGRDLQAEEILKEALRTNPTRVAIHQKLCEIFAKRNDTKSYEDIASQAFKLTNGTGPDWQRICEGGLNIDPSNVLYQPGGQPDHLDDSAALPLAGEGTLNLASDPEATVVVPAVPSKADANGVDLDLDLDFSIEDEPAISEALPSHELSTVIQPRKSAADMHDLDFGMSTVTMEPFVTPQPTTAHDADATLPLITPAHPSDSFRAQAATSFGTTEPAPLSMTTDDSPLEKDHPSTESGMLEFDLGGLSLDLGGTSPAPLDNPVVEPPEDPLGTKLALAEEFSAIGDDDGARALIEEVIMEATGDMKIKAQRALNNL
jgi:pilus assembly protein FimV